MRKPIIMGFDDTRLIEFYDLISSDQNKFKFWQEIDTRQKQVITTAHELKKRQKALEDLTRNPQKDAQAAESDNEEGHTLLADGPNDIGGVHVPVVSPLGAIRRPARDSNSTESEGFIFCQQCCGASLNLFCSFVYTLAKHLGTSVAMIEQHYGHVELRRMAHEIAGG
jgi:hypothetical protein